MKRLAAFFPAPDHLASTFDGWQRVDTSEGCLLLESEVPGAGQVFTSPCGRCTGILCGAIFNLDELWPDSSDHLPLEERLGLLVLNRIEKAKAGFPAPFYGVYSMVVQYEQSVMIVRDAIGERPLYVLEHKRGIAISSALATLLEYSDKQINRAAIADYLGTGFCPFTRTPVSDISKLAPGTCMVHTHGQSYVHQYHHFEAPAAVPPADPPGQLRQLLEDAIEHRRSPTSNTASFLSGGLDSSLVTSLLCQKQPGPAYSITFGKAYRNELEFSGMVSQYLDIEHRVVSMSARDIMDAFPASMRILDEPIGDPLNVPNVLLARAASRDSEIVFNGEGGDPVFGGPKNLPMLLRSAFGQTGPDLSLEELYLMSFNKGSDKFSRLLSPDFMSALSSEPATTDMMLEHLNPAGSDSLLRSLMMTNLKLKGAAQILPKVFKAAGAAGMRVRSPLFDQRVAEFAFQLSDDWKQHGAIEKFVLKEAVKDCLPPEIINRPKSGMLVPCEHWLRKEMKRFARNLLLSKDAATFGMFNRPFLKRLLNFDAGGVRVYHGDRIWLLISLELWLREHDLRFG